MQNPDYVLEDVIDIVAEKYLYCVKKTKDTFKDVFTDEATLQSASATVWINATKEKSAVAPQVYQLREKIAKINTEAIPSAVGVWEYHFRDFIKEFGPRIVGQINYYVSQNMPPEQIERNIRERVYHLRCENLTIEEQNALAKEMFGDD